MTDTLKNSYRVGYARVSTEDQDLSLQISALEKSGVDVIIEEKFSGASMDRRGIAELKDGLRPGDTLVVWRLDRLGRSVKGILNFIDWLNENEVELDVLTEQVDTKTPSGRLVTTVLAALAQMERELTAQRTRDGMQAKKAAGHVFGRKHAIVGNAKRIAAMAPYIESGEVFTMHPDDALEVLNAADPSRKIKSAETFRRWRREGFPGYQSPDELAAQ